MLIFALVAMTSGVLVAGMPETPSDLLDPMNPNLGTHSNQPLSPTRGLKPFAPAEPKDWLQLNQKVTPSDKPGSDHGMPSMPGMGGLK